MRCPALRRYVLTDHVYMQMQRRGITEDDVAAVLETPKQSEEIYPGRCVYQSILTLGVPPKIFLLRVFVDMDSKPPEVVTAYRTTKVQKYWR